MKFCDSNVCFVGVYLSLNFVKPGIYVAALGPPLAWFLNIVVFCKHVSTHVSTTESFNNFFA